jgi:hypothetical protein
MLPRFTGAPQTGVRYQPAFTGFMLHVIQLFVSFLVSPNVEVIETRLPQTVARLNLAHPQSTRHPLLKTLHHRRWGSYSRR